MNLSPRLADEQRFQAVYARFLTDEDFRLQLLEQPEDLVCKHQLEAADIVRCQSMNRHGVELFSRFLSGNRLTALLEAFPLTFKFMSEDQFTGIFEELDKTNIPFDTRKFFEAKRFAEFALDLHDNDGVTLPPAFQKILNYEWKKLKLRFRPDDFQWPDQASASQAGLLSALQKNGNVELVLTVNYNLITLDHDVELLRETAPDLLTDAEKQTFVMLYRKENGFVGELCLSLSSAVAILMFDERQGFSDLCEKVSVQLELEQSKDIEAGLIQLCGELCACGAMRHLQRRPAAEVA